jgi:hypothetical protein
MIWMIENALGEAAHAQIRINEVLFLEPLNAL